MYEIHLSKQYKKQYNKLSKTDKNLTDEIIKCLANDEVLEPIYKDHALQGVLKGCRDCHIKNDLVLVYKKEQNILTLTCISITKQFI